jgi:hypothetical protein
MVDQDRHVSLSEIVLREITLEGDTLVERQTHRHLREGKIPYTYGSMSSEFPKRTTPIPPFKRRRSELPVARAAMGRMLPALSNVEVQILDQEKTLGGNLADFFTASPLRESGLEIERPQDDPREFSMIDLAELDTP